MKALLGVATVVAAVLGGCQARQPSSELTTPVQKGELEGDISSCVSARDAADSSAESADTSLIQKEARVDELRENNTERKEQFKRDHDDLVSAIEQSETAVQLIKASRPEEALVAIRSLRSGESNAAKEMPDIPSAEGSAYDFHSHGVISTLETLADDFRTEKHDIETAELAANHEFEAAELGLKAEIANLKKALEDYRGASAAKTSEIAEKQRELGRTVAAINEDMGVVKDLMSSCKEQEDAWTQRSKMRADELTALAQAIAIIESKVKDIEYRNKRIALTASSTQRLKEIARKVAVSASNAKKHQRTVKAAAGAVLLELRAHREADVRSQIIALLKSRARALRSTVLTSVATRMEEDTLAKIKSLIESMIERLLQEESEEAEHKGWCDMELTKVNQKKRTSTEDKAQYEAEMEQLTAALAKTEEEIGQLTTQIHEIDQQLIQMTATRAEEQKENEASIQDAKEGAEAVGAALDVLAQFYSNAAAAAHPPAAIIETRASYRQEPDAPFTEPYNGSQGEATGILGMLETIQTDFKRTVDETRRFESKAVAEHDKLSREMKSNMSSKQQELKAKGQYKVEKGTALTEATSSRDAAQTALELAMGELEKLKPACIEAGTTYDERKARREEEIDALKEALEIFEGTSFSGSSSPFARLVQRQLDKVSRDLTCPMASH
ncbi:unnamed protein product [Vitrella brassicaformis CCMP3155]|uniref:Uncharacterized protein n=1 Tax=Vitrella brassicaformis (strain CCMP3155) TaxID=1169540 RepID=A0A0G4FZ03_VITBC|nr:unnamed protein product [Vitrella brassicaformis CCMP3155]|eukprot:CEM20850.1 unnamed protein product [Vitrella brassicaformis CCMP3155]